MKLTRKLDEIQPITGIEGLRSGSLITTYPHHDIAMVLDAGGKFAANLCDDTPEAKRELAALLVEWAEDQERRQV